jgi:glycosyltransferase involved in cell wall biosynthesis
VELPYTLPQDSTLFLLLREATPEIWFRKLDWVAQRNGMALVNVHPDYIRFANEAPSARTYPVDHYRQLLEYVQQRYGGSFWQPLAREVASFVNGLKVAPVARSPKRICMVTHSFYESDNRVTRYATALAARGDVVDVFALRRSPHLPIEEKIAGVNVFRLQDRFGKTERSRFSYLWPLLRFLKAAASAVTSRHSAARYDLLHIHNVPDFMVFAAWYPKLTGARIILDIHDIVPEFYVSKFGILPKGLTYSMLRWMERASARFAHHIIIANDLWLRKYASRTNTDGRITPFINNVDSAMFVPRARRRADGKHIIIFPGGLQWHQGVDIAIRAFAKVVAAVPNSEFHIYGDGNARESLIELAASLGVDSSVRFFEPTSVREIAAIMAEADLGVVPKRADSFGDEAYSTKIMEFMAVGVPVVVSSTRVDRYYFDDSVVKFFPSGDVDALANQMVHLLRDQHLRETMIRSAAEYAAAHCWDNRKREYLNLIDHLCDSDLEPALPRVQEAA